MWQSLINWEEAASLKLNWESSHTFQVFLKSLKIDSRNIVSTLFTLTLLYLGLFLNLSSSSHNYHFNDILIDINENSRQKLRMIINLTFLFLSQQQLPNLRDFSTPLIPSKLTILQPTPLLPSIIPLEPQISQQSHQITTPSDSLNNSLDGKQHHEQSASSIPEASFDWNSSGLTNPLEKDWLILL